MLFLRQSSAQPNANSHDLILQLPLELQREVMALLFNAKDWQSFTHLLQAYPTLRSLLLLITDHPQNPGLLMQLDGIKNVTLESYDRDHKLWSRLIHFKVFSFTRYDENAIWKYGTSYPLSDGHNLYLRHLGRRESTIVLMSRGPSYSHSYSLIKQFVQDVPGLELIDMELQKSYFGRAHVASQISKLAQDIVDPSSDVEELTGRTLNLRGPFPDLFNGTGKYVFVHTIVLNLVTKSCVETDAEYCAGQRLLFRSPFLSQLCVDFNGSMIPTVDTVLRRTPILGLVIPNGTLIFNNRDWSLTNVYGSKGCEHSRLQGMDHSVWPLDSPSRYFHMWCSRDRFPLVSYFGIPDLALHRTTLCGGKRKFVWGRLQPSPDANVNLRWGKKPDNKINATSLNELEIRAHFADPLDTLPMFACTKLVTLTIQVLSTEDRRDCPMVDIREVVNIGQNVSTKHRKDLRAVEHLRTLNLTHDVTLVPESEVPIITSSTLVGLENHLVNLTILGFDLQGFYNRPPMSLPFVFLETLTLDLSVDINTLADEHRVPSTKPILLTASSFPRLRSVDFKMMHMSNSVALIAASKGTERRPVVDILLPDSCSEAKFDCDLVPFVAFCNGDLDKGTRLHPHSCSVSGSLIYRRQNQCNLSDSSTASFSYVSHIKSASNIGTGNCTIYG